MASVNISNAVQAHLKRKSLKVARLNSSLGKTDNEIAQGFKKSHDSFLTSAAWKELRRKVIQTYGARCMKCAATPSNPKQINVDHIKPRKYYPHLALEFDNLQVLCCACNKQKGNKDETDYRPK